MVHVQNSDINTKVRFNAVLDIQFSDVGLSTGGGAQVLNLTETGLTFTDTNLIDATIYLLFIDGIQYTQVTTLSVTPAKEFVFDDTTGLITLSVSMPASTPVTIFYYSPLTSSTPGVEPVTVAEAKAYCKIDTSADDTLIGDLIVTAREQCEDFTGISIVNRTITTIVNNSCGGIFLPYCPFISLVSIEDQDGETIEAANYTLSGFFFPQLIAPCEDRIKLVYTVGYGIPPSRIRSAILQQVFYLYENRGETAALIRTGVVELTLSPQARATLQRLRRVG